MGRRGGWDVPLGRWMERARYMSWRAMCQASHQVLLVMVERRSFKLSGPVTGEIETAAEKIFQEFVPGAR